MLDSGESCLQILVNRLLFESGQHGFLSNLIGQKALTAGFTQPRVNRCHVWRQLFAILIEENATVMTSFLSNLTLKNRDFVSLTPDF